MPKKLGKRSKLISVHIMWWQYRELKRLVDEGKYKNISEAIRHAIYLLLWQHQEKELMME